MALEVNRKQKLVEQQNDFAFELQVCEDDGERELEDEEGGREKRDLRADLRPEAPVVPVNASADVAFEYAPAVYILRLLFLHFLFNIKEITLV